MEIETRSPFGDPPHQVVAGLCGINRCARTTPCDGHDQVIVRLTIDGIPRQEYKLAKPAFHELELLHRDPRELFHMLADFAVLAEQAPQIASGQSPLAPFRG